MNKERGKDMRKKINILLGALIALLSGCKTPQISSEEANRVVVMYGSPSYFQQEKKQPVDTIPAKDNTKIEHLKPAN